MTETGLPSIAAQNFSNLESHLLDPGMRWKYTGNVSSYDDLGLLLIHCDLVEVSRRLGCEAASMPFVQLENLES